MGMFDSINLDDAVALDGSLAPDVYPFIVTGFEVKPTAKGTMIGLNTVYTVIAGKAKGQTHFEWQRVPSDAHPYTDFTIKQGPKAGTVITADEQKQQDMNYVKTILAKLGIPESKMNSVEAEDVIGITGMGQIFKNKKLESRLGNFQVKEFTDEDLADLNASSKSSAKNPFE